MKTLALLLVCLVPSVARAEVYFAKTYGVKVALLDNEIIRWRRTLPPNYGTGGLETRDMEAEKRFMMETLRCGANSKDRNRLFNRMMGWPTYLGER